MLDFMSIQSFAKVLILMIVIQSGIVAADVHAATTMLHTQQQSIDLASHEQPQAENTDQHQTSAGDDCAFCSHSHCAHFVAICTANNIMAQATSDRVFIPYQLASIADVAVSMYRPPKS